MGLVQHLARHWPGTVLLAGRLAAESLRWPRSGTIRRIGPVPYDELPRLARGVDAWMIPYVTGPRTDAIDPLKLREYLATGRPVVSTPLPEVRRWQRHVHIAASQEAFLDGALEAAGDPTRGRAGRLAALEGHSWEDRAAVFLRELGPTSPDA